MKKQKYIDDLKEIKDIMSRSSKFISLSGLSGVFAGIFALLGAFTAYKLIYLNHDYLGYGRVNSVNGSLSELLVIAITTLVLSLGAGIFFTVRKAKKNNQKIWDVQTKRLLINLFIPLVTGGIFCLMLLNIGYVGLIPPLTLIFYGLALVNASNFTLKVVRSLGIAQITLGLIATYYIGFGLLFWSIGFGLLHIIYGIVMKIRYGS